MGLYAKIDREKLPQLIKRGSTLTEIAKMYGVSVPAVSKAVKDLKLSVHKDVVTRTGKRLVTSELNAIDQLQTINRDANEILDLVMGWARGDENCIRILETQVKKVKWRDKESGKDRELDIQEIKFKDPRELALKAMAEIRGQLALQLEIFQTLHDTQASAEFKRAVIDILGEVSPELRNKAIRRLKEYKALRKSVTYPQLRDDL